MALCNFEKQRTKHKPMEFFAVFVGDSNQTILGGCNGSTRYGCLYIDQLWVDESLRHQGYGRQLIENEYSCEREHRFLPVVTSHLAAIMTLLVFPVVSQKNCGLHVLIKTTKCFAMSLCIHKMIYFTPMNHIYK